MSKMIIYFCLFIPLLFLSVDSSSIRGRNHKNDLVPFLSSRFDAMKRDPNSMKVVSKDPFIIQLHMPNSKDMEARGAKEKDKKRKRPMKKRVSKLKPLRKKHRKRRDLLTSKTKPREQKLFRFEIPRAVNNTERQLKNTTRNSVNRMEILKALSSYPKKPETMRNKLEGIRNVKDEEKINTGKTKKNNTSNRLHKYRLSVSDRSKLAYPSTPKLDRRAQKYTYKDLIADRERLEQKIKYIKNMLNVNATITDDGGRVRRRSDSDRTANKIAKMFLTLSAVNGLHDKKKSKCNDDDDDDDERVDDVWEKERRNNPLRKSTSSNEERYKVKKWIEFMKNKRSSGKTCPCMRDSYSDESDAFPLEQKLPKGYFLMERGRSSEESSESYRDPYYYSKDKINRNENVKQRLSKTQEQDSKNKDLGKNGKKRLEVPFEDLEMYRSRARQILRSAEEILDKIKEEEEKRLVMPNILMSQLKELTAKIHGDPRNNENDLIRKIQKNLGWGPLSTPQEENDGTFMDNVKSFILDPYEKAKALTDESTKKLSSYLLRNLGNLQQSSEEDKTNDDTLKIDLGEVPDKEETPSVSLAKEEPRAGHLSKTKEDLQNWEDTLSAILGGGDDAVNKESNWNVDQGSSPQEVEDTVKEVQKKLNVYEDLNSKQINTANDKESMKTPQLGEDIVAESKPEGILEEEIVAMKLNEKENDDNKQDTLGFPLKNEKDIKRTEEPGTILEKTIKDSDLKKQPFRGTEGTFVGKEGGDDVQAPREVQEEEEEEEKVGKTLKEGVKDVNKQEVIGFPLENEKEVKRTEEPGTILEKRIKDSDIKKQPFRGTEGKFEGKEGESDVQAPREVQEEEEKVGKTLKEGVKDVNKQDAIGYLLKEEKGKKSPEEPGTILEKTIKDSDMNKQPFRGTEGAFEGKEGGDDVQAPREVQEEEEKVGKTLKDIKKQEAIGFPLENEEGLKRTEEPGTVLEKTIKDSDMKKQPFRGTEGTFEGKEGGDDVQAPREVQEEEEKVGKTLQEGVKDIKKQEAIGFPLENEEGLKRTEEPGTVLEKSIKDSDMKKQPFRGTEGTFVGKEGGDDVQAPRELQEEEKVGKTLKDIKKQEGIGFPLKNEKEVKRTEEPGTILEKRIKDSDLKKQPFRGTEGTFEGKEGGDDVQAPREVQEEEEKVGITLKDRVKDVNKEEAIGFPLKNEKGKKSPEEPGTILEKRIKDSDMKKQPFRGTEGTFEGKEGESDVQAPQNMQEEEEEKVGKTLKERVKDVNKQEAIGFPLENEKEVKRTGEPGTILEKPVKDSDIIKKQPLRGNEETFEGKEGESDVQASRDMQEEEEFKKEFEDIVRMLINESDNESPKTDEVVQKSNVEEKDANEDVVADTLKIQEENQKVSMTSSSELEKTASREKTPDDSTTDERVGKKSDTSFPWITTSKEIGAKTPPEYADLVQEVKPVSKVKSNEEGDSEEEFRMGNEEILELGNEETTSKEITLKAKLDNEENTEEENLESVSKEDSTEDLNTSLRATLDEEKSNLDESFSKESDDDVLLKETNSDDQKNESLEESDPDVKEDGETFLRETLSNQDQDAVESQEYKSSEVSDGDFVKDSSEMNLKASLDKDKELGKDDEVNLKASLDEDEDLEKDEVILKASNRYGLDEIQNVSEEKDVVSQTENQENDNQTGSTEYVEKVLDTQKNLNKDEKSTEDFGTQRENQETDFKERGIETLEKAMNTQETLNKEKEEGTAREENQNAENVNVKDDDETIVRAEKPDENENIKDEETNKELLKSMSNEEIKNVKDKESEEIIKEENPDENVENKKSEILEDILKEIPKDNQKQKPVQVDEDELASNKPREDEYLEKVLKNETQENLEERPDEEILKEEKVDDGSVRSQEEPSLEATLEGQDKDFVLKEANIEDSEEKQDNLEDGEDVRAVFDEILQNFDEDKREKNEEDMDDEKILQKAVNFEKELNNQNSNDETLKAVSEQDEENLEEYLQAENPEIDGEKEDDETPLRSANLEDEFDNKIDYETALKSAKFPEDTDDLGTVKYVNEDGNEETLRAENVPQDLSNQIDEKNEEGVLKSPHFDPKSPDGNGYSYVTVTEDNKEAKSPLKSSNREDANLQENLQERGPLGDPQKPDSNTLKASKLKVPRWIGKIMKDLNGKEKTDVTSIQNLNPDKIDDMLGKIGKAEQQNQLEPEEVDCVKECACAEDMNMRSRNIGRYEIVKDFLHWVKDLQLNRVLSDE